VERAVAGGRNTPHGRLLVPIYFPGGQAAGNKPYGWNKPDKRNNPGLAAGTLPIGLLVPNGFPGGLPGWKAPIRLSWS
jgi:hypothetical protein